MNDKTMVCTVLDLVVDFQLGRDLTDEKFLGHCILDGKPYLLFPKALERLLGWI